MPFDHVVEEGKHLYEGPLFFHKEPKGAEVEEWWECPVCHEEYFHRYLHQNHYTRTLSCKVGGHELERWGGRKWWLKSASNSRVSLLMEGES